MKLISLKYFSYSLNFKNPFITSAGKLKTRKIFIVELKDDNDNSYYGEASPLPEFNSETFEEVEKELQKLTKINEFESGDSLEKIFKNIASLTSLPTVQYALEQIFVTTLLKKDKNVLSGVVKEKDINVNAVIGINDFESSQERIQKIVKQGYQTIKIKTGKDNFEELYEILSWVTGELEAKVKFRIDPNCSWSKKETLQRCKRLASLPIEYIEQPAQDKNELIKIAGEASIPIAADESARTLTEAKDLIDNSKLKFLVIKPMLFGGLENIIKLKKLVEKKDIKIIISSSLESNIGRRHLVLASALVDNNAVHGLGTAELFASQPTEDAFPVTDGKIHFNFTDFCKTQALHFQQDS